MCFALGPEIEVEKNAMSRIAFFSTSIQVTVTYSTALEHGK